MTYRDSDALFLPARRPQHAAPVSLLRRRGSPEQPGASGRLTRQVLKLFMMFVAWATGLGLVISSIVLVATVTAPTHGTPTLKVSPQDAGSRLHQVQYGARSSSGAAVRHRPYQVLAAFSGHGNQKTARFNVKARQAWQLRWTYRCPARDDDGQFTLQTDTGPEQATITTAGGFAASGHGLVWLTPTTHRHYLVVRSACSWRVKVTQAV